jgi:hypothetical protein
VYGTANPVGVHGIGDAGDATTLRLRGFCRCKSAEQQAGSKHSQPRTSHETSPLLSRTKTKWVASGATFFFTYRAAPLIQGSEEFAPILPKCMQLASAGSRIPMVMVDLGRAVSARSSLQTPLPRNSLASQNSCAGEMASEQRDKTCAVALDPASELELEQDRSYYAG